jgi:hypothetical protein
MVMVIIKVLGERSSTRIVAHVITSAKIRTINSSYFGKRFCKQQATADTAQKQANFLRRAQAGCVSCRIPLTLPARLNVPERCATLSPP